MLQIHLSEKKGLECYDEPNNRFVCTPAVPAMTVSLEHSLLSVSKWEARWNLPYLSEHHEKTTEMVIEYLCCMALEPRFIPAIQNANTEEMQQIGAYIESSRTATTISGKQRGGQQIITSELIYGWMVQFRIPFSCEKWHLNRLLMLIRVCGELGRDPKKNGSPSRNWAELNRKRLAATSKG